MHQLTSYNQNPSNLQIGSTDPYGFLNQNQPNPNHPAYKFGQYVIRPSIDLGYSICSRVYGFVQVGFSALDSFFTQVVNIIPGAAAKESAFNGYECNLPEGNYLNSCKGTKVERYVSSDPNVPANTCELTTKCQTIFPQFIPDKENKLYYEANSKLTLGNNNGTLTILNEIKQETPISDLDKVICVALPGSHEETCQIETKPYITTDKNLKSTPFCQMVSKCLTLDNNQIEDNMVYYGHEHLRGSEVVVENCDGKAVIHNTKNADRSCLKKDSEVIKQIARNQGKTQHIIKSNSVEKQGL